MLKIYACILSLNLSLTEGSKDVCMSIRYISLDISTNTGYAVFEDDQLIKYGVFTHKVEEYKADIKTYVDLPKCYPDNFLKIIRNFLMLLCL